MGGFTLGHIQGVFSRFLAHREGAVERKNRRGGGKILVDYVTHKVIIYFLLRASVRK